MIHAYLFVLNIREGNGGHGPNFKRVMEGINRQAGTNISVYHSFHEEVRLYKKHWWRCDGPCRDRKPFYGYVKRCTNRKPGDYDFWFAQHQRDCGGTFIKVKEPTPKKKEPKERKGPQKTNQTNKISNYVQTTKGGGSTAINRGGGTLVITKPPTTKPVTSKPPNKSKVPTGSKIHTVQSPPTQVPPNKPPSVPSNIVGFKDLGQSNGAIPKVPSQLFTSGGQTLGGSNGNKRSRLLDQFEAGSSKKLKTDPLNTSTILLDDDQDDILLAVDLDEIERQNNTTLTQTDKANARQTIIKQEIVDSNGFSDDDDIILIDDEYDDDVVDDLNLSNAVIDDLFGDDMQGNKKDDSTIPCPICEKRVSSSSQKAHIEQCYEDLLKACEVGSTLPIPGPSTSNAHKGTTSTGVINNIKKEKKSPQKDESDVIVITETGPVNGSHAMVQCPVCPRLIPPDEINEHLDKCLENSFDSDF